MASKPAYYWDACLFYEVLGDEPVALEKKQAVNEFLQDNKDGKSIVITSILTHLEVLPTKLEQKMPGAEKSYMGLFDGKRFVDVEISRNILMRAREIREFYFRPPGAAANPGTPAKMMDAADAVHLATASIYGVEAFHTRDDDAKGTKIPLVSLYQWSGQDKLCGKYALKIVSPENAQTAMDLTPPAPTPEPIIPKVDNLFDGLTEAEIDEILSGLEDEEPAAPQKSDTDANPEEKKA